MSLAADDRETQARHAAFLQALQQSGRIDGRNAQIEFRGATDADHIRQHVAELVALAPDIILSSGTAVAGPLGTGDPHSAHTDCTECLLDGKVTTYNRSKRLNAL